MSMVQIFARWKELLKVGFLYFHRTKRLLDCLQSVLKAAARLLCNRRKYDHITPLLRDVLHWLPVPLRVEFKICLLVYKSLHGAAPGYLREYCKETHSSASGLRL